ncbi:MAG: hypothetical protein R3C08_08735 [Hyphomonas sp.]
MTRFLVIFGILLVIAMSLMGALLAQNGYSLFDPKMTPMVLVAVLVAAYVSWRIDGILRRRNRAAGEDPAAPGKSGFDFFAPKASAGHAAREARVAAKRKQLIAEGKLEADPVPEPVKPSDSSAPTRVSQSAPIKDRMAARAERVRRAKEEGKI